MILIVLLAVAFVLIFQNYSPGTFLSGWDTLHPEFNFPLNFERVITGVFREEQGLGAVAAHSHMADFPRILLLFLLHFTLPLDTLRYFYIFLMLLLGPIGMYFFLKRVVVKKKIPAFLGGLFYLLNLGTMQQFIVPFEMFTTQYASLPWLFLFATRYLSAKGLKKDLFFFAITILLAAPMAYAATLWYINILALAVYLLLLSFPTLLKKEFHIAKKATLLLLVTFLLNAFWIIPNIYFVISHGSEVSQANINKLFSTQAFLYNKEFGNLKDIVLLKSFLFDWHVYAGNNTFEPLLASWIEHLKNPVIEGVGFALAVFPLVGLFYGLLKRNQIGLSLLPVLALCLFFLINENPPTGFVYRFISENTPLFAEALRFPHDKVFGLFTFIYTVYFAVGTRAFIGSFSRLPKRLSKAAAPAYLTIVSLLLFSFILPAFSGHLISPSMRVKIPQEYFEMFLWFNKQEDTERVANLPVHSFWGWEYYNWYNSKAPSFQGAGFLWFGMKQPLLARDFDRWSTYNEQYYREMSYAIYSQDTKLFAAVLEKYNIAYVLLDTSIVAPETDQNVLFYKEILTLLDTHTTLHKAAQFGNHLFVYKTNIAPPSLQKAIGVSSEAQAFYTDFPYQKYGTYMLSSNAISYPLKTIMDNQGRVLSNTMAQTQQGIVVRLPEVQTVRFPSYLETEQTIAASTFIEKRAEELRISVYPRFPLETGVPSSPIIIRTAIPENSTGGFIVSVNQNDIAILRNVPDNTPLAIGTIFLHTKTDNTIALYPITPDQTMTPDFSAIPFDLSPCDRTQTGRVFGVKVHDQKNSFTLFGEDTAICMMLPLGRFFPDASPEEVLLSVTFSHTSDLTSRMCLANLPGNTCVSKSPLLYSVDGIYLGVKSEQTNDVGMRVFFDTTHGEEKKEVSYNNIDFHLTKPFFLTRIPKETLLESLPLLEMREAPIEKGHILIPFSGKEELSQDITRLPKTNGSCLLRPFIGNKGKITKELVENGNERYIRYVAQENVLCDYFSYGSLTISQGYVIAVTARNVEGLPLTMCVTNHISRRCDVYAHLSKSRTFTTDTFLLPPMGKGQGFDINLNALGIKGTQSVNDLASIEVIPFPYTWLSQIEHGQTELRKEVFLLPQSFDRGWRAYELTPSTSNLTPFHVALPFLFGKELTNHVLINNWENGWVVQKSEVGSRKSEIVIVYLPQYLEFIGFGILGGTLLVLCAVNLKSKLVARS